jgi:hypothetical protein
MKQDYEVWNSGYGFVQLGAAAPVRVRLDKPVLWILSMLPESELLDLYARMEGMEFKQAFNRVADYGTANRSLAIEQVKNRICEHVDRAHSARFAEDA